ncbi:acyl-CoA desaturase [Collimonas humicola]|uniref:acyl-CoA desaturase n=1 Tax=Collimonas humicola TaxID=2825886 RepID=UPI001B8B93E1|nr:fatty acid desaturase [Collimonas humicola]
MMLPILPFPRVRRAFKVTALFVHQWLWLGIFAVPFQLSLLAPCVILGFLLILGVELGHHRYFSHRSFRTGRVFQFVLGVWATAAFQRDVLWWASMHRLHHRFSDTPNDPHSPYAENAGGYWHAHLVWAVVKRNAEVDQRGIPDLLAYPELRWLGNWHYLISIALAAICYSLGASGLAGTSGWQTLIWLYVMPVFICQHVISCQATFAHAAPRLPGAYRSFETDDESVNHLLMGLVSSGGGFHNNHHRFPGSARLGLKPGEFDITYLVIKVLHRLGIVHKVTIPRAVLSYIKEQREPRP